MTEDQETQDVSLDRARIPSAVAALVGLVACVVFWIQDPPSFFRAYLFGYLFWLGLALGSLSVVMVHHLVGGAWGFLIQRLLEAASRTIPLMLVLFVPIALGTHDLYHWTHKEAVAQDEMLRHKAPYLNETFFYLRALFYFGTWSLLAWVLTRWSYQQDRTGSGRLSNRLEKLSGPGLLLYVITTSFAAIDWVMSLDPHWFSTIFGLLFVVGQGLATFAFGIFVLCLVRHTYGLRASLSVDRLHDLGKLLFAFVLLNAYLQLSQFLIIWFGNMPEEITWYLHRTRGGFEWLAYLLVAFQFLLPFFLLLSRHTKRHFGVLGAAALLILTMRFVDLYWLVMPSATVHHLHVRFVDVVAPLALGGMWIFMFLSNLRKHPLLPLKDPRMTEVFGHGSH